MIRLNNQFRVNLPIDEAWKILTDLPLVATCLPGAALDEVVDGEYRGGLSTRIGPITARYRGAAAFLEQDELAHRAVISARGREEKGSGSASANITATLVPDGGGTVVKISTELAISGRAAQFGRSLLAEVSNTMLAEFVGRLEAMIMDAGPDGTRQRVAVERAPTVRASLATSEARPSGDAIEPNELNVIPTLAIPLLRKASVPMAVAAVAGVVGFIWGCRRRRPDERPRVVYLVHGSTSDLM